MTLPAPNLDDRRFQDLVDDAKRMVQQRCPEWTDHNVSDPGVTLIETFAFMVDELLYRLNRVPDKLYVTYLDLLGVTLHPATPAVTELTMWLSGPQEEDVVVPEDTEASTLRTESDESVVFATTRPLVVPPRSLLHLMTQQDDGNDPLLRSEELLSGAEFPCFGAPPRLGDTMLVGLDEPAPSCAVALRFDCDVQGVGVDPSMPPLVWEAWDGADWVGCELEYDQTGGLNRAGDVVVHVPPTHQASVVNRLRAGWLRARIVEAVEGYPFYSASPTIRSASAFTIGGTVRAVHAETVREEILGLSEGVAGQVFPLDHGPVVAGGAFEVEVAGGAGWETWTEVDTFAGCDAQDSVFRVDRSSGVVHFGPAVRERDGAFTVYGAVPPKGTPIRVPRYRTGGGPRGNVAAKAVSVLRSTIPLVDRVENRRAATGGVAAETIDQAKVRGPLALRTRDRAVTVEDYEQLSRRAAPGIARVRCVPAGEDTDAGSVRVLVVPSAAVDERARLRFEDLVPSAEMLAAVSDYIEPRRTVGTRVIVEPPFYQGITVVAKLIARGRASTDELREQAIIALNRYFDPITGGPDGEGWPFGRPVQAGEVYAVLQNLHGTEYVDDVRLFAADPITGKRGEPVQRIELDRNALAFSYEHQIRVAHGS